MVNQKKHLSMTIARIIAHLRGSNSMRIDISFVLGINLTLMALGLFTGALVARLLGPEGRGQIAAIQLWGLFLISLGSMGVPQALIYFSGR